MCAVSMVTQHYMDRWPNYQQFPQVEFPNYAELVRKARLYDEMMKQPDCPDPAKERWHKELLEFMKKRYGLEPLV